MSNLDREIHVETIRHEKTGLLVAVSEDMKGLYVHGRTQEELEARIPIAIKAILEAEQDVHVEVERVEQEPSPRGFVRSRTAYKFSEAA